MNRITIETEKTDYTGGDVVNGRCSVTIEQALPARGIRIRYHGYERSSWTTGSGKNRRTHTETRTFFDDEQIHYDTEDETFYVDEDRDGVTDYEIGNPDFNFKDFNSNLVIRWEYQPGSVLYLVWSQSRNDYLSSVGNFNMKNDMRDLFAIYPHNIFLIKLSKWFSL